MKEYINQGNIDTRSGFGDGLTELGRKRPDVVALCAALDMAVTTKVTPMIFSSAVGTPTKIANLRQSIWNTILNNPVSSSVDMFERNTWEPWDNVFKSIAEDISKFKGKLMTSSLKITN